MRIAMGLLRNKFGVYYVRKKVSKRLERAVAQELRNGKERQSFLKRSLKTKRLDEAKRRAPAVLLEMNGVISRAEARLADKPARTTLGQPEPQRGLEACADFCQLYARARVMGFYIILRARRLNW
jgi:hypothetical protein